MPGAVTLSAVGWLPGTRDRQDRTMGDTTQALVWASVLPHQPHDVGRLGHGSVWPTSAT